MDNKEIIEIYSLAEDASEEDMRIAMKAGAQAIDDLAAERARAESSEADAKSAKDDKEKVEVELDNEKKAHEADKAALANEKALRADMALDRAVAEKRIGETARETWKTRLVNEGDSAYTALANEKPLSTTDRTKGLANACGEKTDHEKRMAMVNEIMDSDKCSYDDAWAKAEKKDPTLFGKK
ncbi:MAG: hypothetical protein II265_05200 [Clostridia bacterium]|nr:hypothetical protein [Clostridia bacterium]